MRDEAPLSVIVVKMKKGEKGDTLTLTAYLSTCRT